MSTSFVKNMAIRDVAKYKRPLIITMSGAPGSGKTYVARQLSKQLNIYLLSNDYVRNFFYQDVNDYSEEKRIEVQKKVESIQIKRLLKLLLTRTSFVFDRDCNTLKDFEKISKYIKLMNYKLIKIKINSNDSDNIDRISRRVTNYDYIIEGVIGDNVEYSTAFDETEYYQIQQRKPQTISDDYFDYVINNSKGLSEFDESINAVIEDIKVKVMK